jgi:phenylacetate-CoA ligase
MTTLLRPLSPFLSWPPFLATPRSSLPDFMRGLAASERWTPAEIALGSQSQRMLLLEWAANNVPWYQRLEGLKPALKVLRRSPERFEEVWAGLPILAKATLRSDGPQLDAPQIPQPHLPLAEVHTSGSTGIPVRAHTTALTRILWNALTLREHLWQQRQFMKRLGIVRARPPNDRPQEGRDQTSWGPPVAQLYRTGPASVLHVGYPLEVIVTWLRRFDPHYLLTYPSVAEGLLEALGPGGKPAALEEIRLFSEPLDAALEARLTSAWGVRLSNNYSANEVGHIAFRCREQGALHVQSESIHVELLRDDGSPCAVGETGRVVLTPLHNLATVLIRYEIGDYATWGEPCACGRTLPVIREVLGRVRNFARRPDGSRFWPVALHKLRAIEAIRQSQWVQTGLETIELRLVLSRPLTGDEEQQATGIAQQLLKHPFNIVIVPVESIPRGPTGKFEEFLSQLPDQA